MSIAIRSVRAALISAVSIGGLLAGAAQAQDAEASFGVEDIIVTAQRQSQSLQDVPIAVSAFTSESLERQQINNSSQLQLTLPNVTFSKGNFTAASFTIRGIGDLCTGVTCDSATGIALNDLPLFGTRLFETEFFDLERIEVLRGPQGTLFGRNATSGVVNIISAKPQLDRLRAKGEASYGNYNEIRLSGMLNVPLSDSFGVRVAGFYLKRDGYTENLFDGSDIDGRDMYALRGSLRWEPGENTTIDVMGYYFREKDDRLRNQKQLCQRDPTGVLGCLPGRLENETTNFNSTFVGTLSSRELLQINGGAALGGPLSQLGLGSLYGPDVFAGNINPRDPRQVRTAYTPTYFADEIQVQARVQQDFGDLRLKVSGQYQRNRVDSSQDYYLSVNNRAGYAPGLNTLAAYAAGAGGPVLQLFAPVAAALIPGGPNGELCTSLAEETGTGSYGGHKVCSATAQNFDRSVQNGEAWTGEAILSSQFDGRFNFLLGFIYNDAQVSENSYYVNGFGIDYVAGVLGVASALGAGAPNSFLGTPFFRNNTDDFRLKSYGIFGETYFDLTDTVKLTAGLRYNNDRKSVRARSTLASFLVPFGTANAFDSPFVGLFDADPGTPGNQLFSERAASFSEFTGRAVIDWAVSSDSLLYASYSRGYKSGGINPPLQPIFEVPDAFGPEFVNAFEVGSKNRFLDGTLQLNLTAFYYKYKSLQLSRIVARTSVNDNVDANIYGFEIDAIAQPVRGLAVNIGFSYLHTEVSTDKFLSNPRDPSGGRSDAVIVKDITNGSNCAVVPRVAGDAAASNFHVGLVNSILSGATPGLLQPPTAFPANSGINGATGAFSICAQLANPAFPTTPSIEVLNSGVPVNIKGNKLPQAPNFKASAGVQYTAELDNGMSIIPRWDLAFTGESFGNIFNGGVNRVPSYAVMNAQIQVNGPEDRWFVRGFIQNITDNNATTGLYVTDQSSGLFTNIFTLEPRRFGIAAGFSF